MEISIANRGANDDAIILHNTLVTNHLRGKRLADADKAFHDLLIQATENDLWIIIMEAVTDIYREMMDLVIRNADEEDQNRLRQCHEDIFSGLTEKNSEKMLHAIEQHYDMIEELLGV